MDKINSLNLFSVNLTFNFCLIQRGNQLTLATSCEELTHWKRPWCWEGLGAGGEGDGRGWDGRMASLTRWAWVWGDSGSWWWTGRPGVLRFMGSQSQIRLSDWTELNSSNDRESVYHGNLLGGQWQGGMASWPVDDKKLVSVWVCLHTAASSHHLKNVSCTHRKKNDLLKSGLKYLC